MTLASSNGSIAPSPILGFWDLLLGKIRDLFVGGNKDMKPSVDRVIFSFNLPNLRLIWAVFKTPIGWSLPGIARDYSTKGMREYHNTVEFPINQAVWWNERGLLSTADLLKLIMSTWFFRRFFSTQVLTTSPFFGGQAGDPAQESWQLLGKMVSKYQT